MKTNHTKDETPTPDAKTVEILAQKLHEWYLEATDQDGAKYNHEAVVPYEDLPEGSKLLDRYIAGKIIADLQANAERDRATTLTLLRERVEDDMKIGCYEGCNCRLRLRNIIDEVLGKE